jgi:hypothetical protein
MHFLFLDAYFTNSIIDIFKATPLNFDIKFNFKYKKRIKHI